MKQKVFVKNGNESINKITILFQIILKQNHQGLNYIGYNDIKTTIGCFRVTTFGAFESTWNWGVDVDGKNKEFELLYK